MGKKIQKPVNKARKKDKYRAIFVVWSEIRFSRWVKDPQEPHLIEWERPLPPEALLRLPRIFFKFAATGKRDHKGRYIYMMVDVVKK